MPRRRFLATCGLPVGVGLVGCLDRVPGIGLDTDFEQVDPEYGIDEPPAVTVDDAIVITRGTILLGLNSLNSR